MYGAARTCGNMAFLYREKQREERVREREREGTPRTCWTSTYSRFTPSTLRTRRRYAPRVTWKVIHVKQKAKHCVIAGETRVGEFQMWTMRMYDILGSEGWEVKV